MTDHWIATPPADYRGPRIALVHGLAAGRHMEQHLLKFLRDAGLTDTTLFSHYEKPAVLARHFQHDSASSRPRVLVGYSQGGFQCVKAAQTLDVQGIGVDLLVTVAAGGAGRLFFPQIGFNPRRIPGNVKRCLNFYAEGDPLGTDPLLRLNQAQAQSPHTQVENIAFPRTARIDHLTLVRCYPPARVAPLVRERFLSRLLAELQGDGGHLHGDAANSRGAHGHPGHSPRA